MLEDSRSLVTGASRGIGAAIARRLAAAGSEVILVGRTTSDLGRVRDEIHRQGGRAELAPADLAAPSEIERLVDAAGTVDILVNNAYGEPGIGPVIESDRVVFESALDVGFWAPYELIRALARGMVERGRGSIIQISSVTGESPLPGSAPYCCAKAALEMLTRVVAMELAPAGVRCNGVRPGAIRTRRLEEVGGDGFIEHQTQAIPMGRLGEESEIADVVAWLASDASQYVTGQMITADGGMLAGQYLLARKLAEATSGRE
jgi:NAD(P)-dependent dehydrogenase (short-subunit alcohol dehydrogenase family)